MKPAAGRKVRRTGGLQSAPSRYVLATGDEAAYRLRIVNEVHGADTEAFLKRAGIRRGLRVADIGCGVGVVSAWIAEQIGPEGELIGLDISAAQVEKARSTAEERGILHSRFETASADSTGLPPDSFDLVFCRFVLMHMERPENAVGEMRRILKPGGVLAVEDGDFTSPWCHPPLPAFDRVFELYRALGDERGQRFTIGRELYRLVLDAGFREPEVTLSQPVFNTGDAKRLPEWTLTECAAALIDAGLAAEQEIERLATELKSYAEDTTTLIAMARMTQVRALK